MRLNHSFTKRPKFSRESLWRQKSATIKIKIPIFCIDLFILISDITNEFHNFFTLFIAGIPSSKRLENVVGDIGFIVDASASHEFLAMRDFIIYLMYEYGIKKDGAHASVLTFDRSRPKIQFKFNQFSDYYSFRNKLAGITFGSGKGKHF